VQTLLCLNAIGSKRARRDQGGMKQGTAVQRNSRARLLSKD
jgi:hypothetical protein